MKKNLTILILLMIASCTMLFGISSEAKAATQKGYTIRAGNTRVYSDTGLSKRYGWIYDTDEIMIHQITASYSKVTYNIKGGTKTGYVPSSALFTKFTGKNYSSKAKITTYRRPNGREYGYVSPGDRVLVLGSVGNYTQIRYPVATGYKFSFVRNTDCAAYLTGNSAVSSNDALKNIASKYGIATNGTAYKALLSINTKYAQLVKANQKRTLVFLFEGAGNNSSTFCRENAMCVVVKNGSIVYINRNSSTLPDNPFSPKNNGGTPVPTVRSGIYNFTTTNHPSSYYGRYAALKIQSANAVRFKNKFSYYTSNGLSTINVHRKVSNSNSASTATWGNSTGCCLIGKTNEYLAFAKAIGILNSNVSKVRTYQNNVNGKIVINRDYADSYLRQIGYSANAIKYLK